MENQLHDNIDIVTHCILHSACMYPTACYWYEDTALYVGFYLVYTYLPVAVQVDTGCGYMSYTDCLLLLSLLSNHNAAS